MKLDNDTVIGVIDPDDYHIELHLSDLVEPYRTALEIGMAAMEVTSLSHEAHAAITELDRQRAAGYNPHEVSWVILEALQRAYAARLAAGKAEEKETPNG